MEFSSSMRKSTSKAEFAARFETDEFKNFVWSNLDIIHKCPKLLKD